MNLGRISPPLLLSALLFILQSSALPAPLAAAEPGERLVIAQQDSQSAPPAEALVLGIREKDGSLKTYFIDASSIQLAGAGIAVPRKTGWWKLDVVIRTNEKGNIHVSQVAAAPQGKALEAPSLSDYTECEEHNETNTVLFVGSDYASIESSTGGYCGGAHPYAFRDIETRPLEALSGSAKKTVSIDELLGAGASAQLTKDGTAARGDDDCLSEPNPSEWALIRTQGHWVARGGLSYAYEACRGQFKAYTVHSAVPASLTSHDTLPKDWEAYKKLEPGLMDVVASPKGTLEVFVTQAGFKVVHAGKTVAEQASPDSAIVLAQWAVGTKNVERWRKAVVELLK